MEDNRIAKTKKIMYGTFFVMCVAVGFAIYFVILPIIGKVYETKDEFEQRKLVFKSMKDDATKANSYVDLLENIKSNEELLGNALIKKGDEVLFIEKIEAIATQIGNEISIEHRKVQLKKNKTSALSQDQASIERRKQEEEQEKSKVMLMINVTGNYRSFLEFMYRFENMPYIFEIESVTIDKRRNVGKLLSSEKDLPDYTEGHILISLIPTK